MYLIILVLVSLFVSHEMTYAMQRQYEVNPPPVPSFKLLQLPEGVPELIFTQILTRPAQVQVPQSELRLVCKLANRVCEQYGMRWQFDNDNFHLFLGALKQSEDWVKKQLLKVTSLNFYCKIPESSVQGMEVELADEEWEDKYVFTNKDKGKINEIIKEANRLRELCFYNIPSLEVYLKDLPNAGSLTSFVFDYNANIYDASINPEDLKDCLQFINLQRMCVHTGIFTYCNDESITRFFINFPQLRSLELLEIMRDDEINAYTTQLIGSLSCLRALEVLQVCFIDIPDLNSLLNVACIELKTLSIRFSAKPGDEDLIPVPSISQLLEILPSLKNLSIHNEYFSKQNLKDDEIVVRNNNDIIQKMYPKLESVQGNYAWFYVDHSNGSNHDTSIDDVSFESEDVLPSF